MLRFGLYIGLLATFPAGRYLSAQSNFLSNMTFRNIDPSVAYVGSKACAAAGCHEDIGRTYPTTPMGHSMAPANTPAELGRVPQPVTVFNAANNRYYEAYQEGARPLSERLRTR